MRLERETKTDSAIIIVPGYGEGRSPRWKAVASPGSPSQDAAPRYGEDLPAVERLLRAHAPVNAADDAGVGAALPHSLPSIQLITSR